MGITIYTPKFRTARQLIKDILFSKKHKGRPATRLPGSWLSELCEQRFACVIICDVCRFRYIWDLRRHGYVHDSDYPYAAYCDACRDWNDSLRAYYAEEKFKSVRVTNQQHNKRRQDAIVRPEEMWKLTQPKRRKINAGR